MHNQLGISGIARRDGGKGAGLTMPQPTVLRLNLHGGMVAVGSFRELGLMLFPVVLLS